MGVWVCVHVIVNAITSEPFHKFLWQQDMVKSSDDFENGYTPMRCGAQVVSGILLSASLYVSKRGAY